MFDRAMAAVVTTAAAAAAVVMIVFALGFALYALIEPNIGSAAAAAGVALVAALLVAVFALVTQMRKRKHEREAALAQAQLMERESAGLPPYSHLAMLRAEARTASAALNFLQAAAAMVTGLDCADAVTVYPPVPLTVARVADVERMQMLVESASRRALQQFLAAWLPALHELRTRLKGPEQRILRWALDVDPLTI